MEKASLHSWRSLFAHVKGNWSSSRPSKDAPQERQLLYIAFEHSARDLVGAVSRIQEIARRDSRRDARKDRRLCALSHRPRVHFCLNVACRLRLGHAAFINDQETNEQIHVAGC